jgi:hypothetical protein
MWLIYGNKMRKLRQLLRWFNSNKQWLFSGVGCAIFGGILTAIWGGHIAPAPYVHKDQLGGRRLGSPSAINAAVESLAAGSTKRIQLLIQVLGENPHLPDSLAETIARRISERNRLGIPIKYDPVLVFDSEDPPKGFVKALLARGEAFSRHGVAQFVRPRYLDQKHTPRRSPFQGEGANPRFTPLDKVILTRGKSATRWV